jgi:hypothetical protein
MQLGVAGRGEGTRLSRLLSLSHLISFPLSDIEHTVGMMSYVLNPANWDRFFDQPILAHTLA